MPIYAGTLITNVPVTMDHESHSVLIYSGIAVLDYVDVLPGVEGDWSRDYLEFRVSDLDTTKWDVKKHWSAAVIAWPTSFDVEERPSDLRGLGWAVDDCSVNVALGGGLADVSVHLAWKTGAVKILRVGYQLTLAR